MTASPYILCQWRANRNPWAGCWIGLIAKTGVRVRRLPFQFSAKRLETWKRPINHVWMNTLVCSSSFQFSDRRWSTECGVIERFDHHCGDDLINKSFNHWPNCLLVYSNVAHQCFVRYTYVSHIDFVCLRCSNMSSLHFASYLCVCLSVCSFVASPHSQPVCPKMCSVDIFVDLQLVGRNLKGRLFSRSPFCRSTKR